MAPSFRIREVLLFIYRGVVLTGTYAQGPYTFIPLSGQEMPRKNLDLLEKDVWSDNTIAQEVML
jgi:hypothetical protein